MKSQHTLDYWFNDSKDDIQKTVFFLNYETMKATWLIDKPTNCTSSFITKWNKVPITVCTNSPNKNHFTITESYYNEKAIPFLKSNLQKCIRRGLNTQALKTSYHLIKLSINDFLRRISVITIEDVILHESYSTIIWVMAAISSKKNKFKLTKDIIDFLLGYVDTLCNIKNYDINNYDKTNYDLAIFKNYDLLLSLQFRVAYGGRKSDVKMLNGISKIWLDRFTDNSMVCNNELITPINSVALSILSFKEWKVDGNYIGVDYHCAPHITTELTKKYGYSEDEIESVIWNCSSSVNYRKTEIISNSDMEIWDEIREDLFVLQHDALKRIFGLKIEKENKLNIFP